MPSRDPMLLVPELREKYFIFKEKTRALGHEHILTCTARTYREQVALYAQGRESLGVVNKYRRMAGLAQITEEENSRCVTWTMRSKHIINLDDNDGSNDLSYAFDIALIKWLNGKKEPLWQVKVDVDADGIPDYEEVARVGRSLGLVCGIDFRKPDPPHYQLGEWHELD